MREVNLPCSFYFHSPTIERWNDEVKHKRTAPGCLVREDGKFSIFETNWVNRAHQKYIPNNRCREYQRLLPSSETSLFISFHTFCFIPQTKFSSYTYIHLGRRESTNSTEDGEQQQQKEKVSLRFSKVVFGSFCNHLMWVYHQIIIPCCDFPFFLLPFFHLWESLFFPLFFFRRFSFIFCSLTDNLFSRIWAHLET